MVVLRLQSVSDPAKSIASGRVTRLLSRSGSALRWGFSLPQMFSQILYPLLVGGWCVLAGVMPHQLALFSLLCLCFQQHSWGSSPGQLQTWSQTSLMGPLCQMCSLLLEENSTD